jgi:poly(A) polymerase
VGGCVRDFLLGRLPKDFDVTTDAPPDVLTRLFPQADLVGAHFGVVLVKDGGTAVEVATFRSEGEYTDGRRPDEVHFEKNPERDAQRRDFTINGLFQDPFTDEVLDFVGGRADLESRTLRAIGDAERRFTEDHLRMLRAVRFAARLGFLIEGETARAIEKLAPKIVTVSAERTRDEVSRILTEGGARYGFELLDQLGLLKHVLPEVEAFHGVQQPPQFHPEGDVWTHVLMMLEAMRSPSSTLAWGVLLHDVGKPATYREAEDRIRFDGHAEVGAQMTSRILERFRMSTADAEQVTSLVAHHMQFKDVQQMRPSTLKRFLRMPAFDEHLELHRLDCFASNGYTAAYEFVQQQREQLSEEELRPPKLLTGNDLIAEGFQPGPSFRSVLDAVESAQLDGSISTKEQALVLAKEHLQGK